MGYIGVITHLIINLLLTSWDIQAKRPKHSGLGIIVICPGHPGTFWGTDLQKSINGWILRWSM